MAPPRLLAFKAVEAHEATLQVLPVGVDDLLTVAATATATTTVLLLRWLRSYYYYRQTDRPTDRPTY